jgi:hypothetical protein
MEGNAAAKAARRMRGGCKAVGCLEIDVVANCELCLDQRNGQGEAEGGGGVRLGPFKSRKCKSEVQPSRRSLEGEAHAKKGESKHGGAGVGSAGTAARATARTGSKQKSRCAGCCALGCSIEGSPGRGAAGLPLSGPTKPTSAGCQPRPRATAS